MNLFTPKSKLFKKLLFKNKVERSGVWWRIAILHIRKPMLYPTELRALSYISQHLFNISNSFEQTKNEFISLRTTHVLLSYKL